MIILHLDDEAALEALLRSRALPAEVRAGPVSVQRTKTGIEIATAELKEKTINKLRALGVRIRFGELDGDEKSCWAEILPTVAIETSDLGEVVFLAETEHLFRLSASMLRLGCDEQEICFLSEQGASKSMLRSPQVPYYALLQAMDSESIEVFTHLERAHNQVLIEVGYQHPLVDQIQPEESQLLLISGSGKFRFLPNGPWESFYACADLILAGATSFAPGVPERISVPLRLRRTSVKRSPMLWLLHQEGKEQLERLANILPERELARLAFTRFGEGSIYAVRTLRIDRDPVQLELDAEPFTTHPQIENLFLPIGTMVEPPLRKERLQELLAPQLDHLYWTTAQDKLTVASIPEAAFRPLLDFVDFLLEEQNHAIAPWVENAVFDLQKIQIVEHPEVTQTSVEQPEPPEPAAQETETIEETETPTEPDPPPITPRRRERNVSLSEAAPELEALERTFCQADADPQQEDWIRLGETYAEHSQVQQACLAFAHALWSTGWSSSILKRLVEAVSPDQTLEPDARQKEPSTEQLYANAAAVLEACSRDDFDATRFMPWFRHQERRLDVRTQWLLVQGLSTRTGRDQLTILGTHDSILAQLRRGPSLARDTPAFVRKHGAEDRDQIPKRAADLEARFEQFCQTKRARSPLEAPVELTTAYVRLLVAWGLARLGATVQAEASAMTASETLTSNGVHEVLLALFRSRIQDALDGVPSEASLPETARRSLANLQKLERYKVDRLLQASHVLEWTQKDDPFSSFSRRVAGSQPALDLDQVADPDEALAILRERLSNGLNEVDDVVFVLEVAARLPETHAVPIVVEVIEKRSEDDLQDRLQIIEAAVRLTLHLRDHTLQTVLEKALLPIISVDTGLEMAPFFARTARFLKRTAMASSARRVLEKVRWGRSAGIQTHTARLQIGTALAIFGDPDPVEIAATKALTSLKKKGPIGEARLGLIRDIALAAQQMPHAVASEIADQLMAHLAKITDRYNTNTHFCFSVVHFMESVVLCTASDHTLLVPWAQQWIESDEANIRERLARDTRI